MAVKLHDSDSTLKNLFIDKLFSFIPKFFFVDAKSSHQHRTDFMLETHCIPTKMDSCDSSPSSKADSQIKKFVNNLIDSVCRPKICVSQPTAAKSALHFVNDYFSFAGRRKLPEVNYGQFVSEMDYQVSIAVEKSLQEMKTRGGFSTVSNDSTESIAIGDAGNSNPDFDSRGMDMIGGFLSENCIMGTDFFPMKDSTGEINRSYNTDNDNQNCSAEKVEMNENYYSNARRPQRQGLSASRRQKKRKHRNSRRRRSRSTTTSTTNPVPASPTVAATVIENRNCGTNRRKRSKKRRQRKLKDDELHDDINKLCVSTTSEDECDEFRTTCFADGLLDVFEPVDLGVDLWESDLDISIEFLETADVPETSPMVQFVVQFVSVTDDDKIAKKDDWDRWDADDNGDCFNQNGLWEQFQNCGLNASNLFFNCSQTRSSVDVVDCGVVDEVDPIIREANARWLANITQGCDNLVNRKANNRKKVWFADDSSLVVVHVLHSDEGEIRKGPWEEMARDCERFRLRTKNLEPVLSRILTPEHRETAKKRIDAWVEMC